MIHRSLLNISRIAVARQPGAQNLQKIRQLHKGCEATPPMRWMSIPERVGFYLFIAFTFLTYPTYVMLRLDNLRPTSPNSLNEGALEERERRIAARR